MPFDGSGNFTRSYNFVNDKNGGIKIVASRMDAEFDNYAGALNQVLLRSGVAGMTGSLNMGTNTINSIGNGTVSVPALRFNTDPTSGIYMPGYAVVGMSILGIERLQANNTGVNVTGIFGVSGNTTVGGTLGVTGGATFVNGSFSGTLGVTGVSTLGTANITTSAISGNATVGGTLGVTGLASFVNATASGTFGVTGATTLSGTVGIGGVLTANSAASRFADVLIGSIVPKNRLTVSSGSAFNTPVLGAVGGFAYFSGPDINYGLSMGNSNLSGDAWLQAQRTDASTLSYNIQLNPVGGNVLVGTQVNRNRLTVVGVSASGPNATAAAGSVYISGTNPDFGACIGVDGGTGDTWIQPQRTDGSTLWYNTRLNPSGGNVGIGTGTMDAKLTLQDGGIGQLSFKNTSAVTQGYIATSSLFGTAPTNALRIRGEAGIVLGTLGGIAMTIDTSNNIGIGRTPVNHILDAEGRARFLQNALGGAVVLRSSAGDAQGGYIQFVNNASSVQLGTIGVDTFGNLSLASNSAIGLRVLVGGIPTDGSNRELGFRDLPQNAQAGAYTLVADDRGKHVYCTGGAAAVTIPTNASVAFPIGTAVTLVNDGSGARTITRSGGVALKQAGTGTDADRTLAVGGIATLLKVGTNTWYVSGVGVT